MVDEHKASRGKVVWGAALVTFSRRRTIGALSQGANEWLGNFGWIPERLTSPDFLSQMSFVFGDFSLAFGALMLSIFIGWIWGADKASDRAGSGGGVLCAEPQVSGYS